MARVMVSSFFAVFSACPAPLSLTQTIMQHEQPSIEQVDSRSTGVFLELRQSPRFGELWGTCDEIGVMPDSAIRVLYNSE